MKQGERGHASQVQHLRNILRQEIIFPFGVATTTPACVLHSCNSDSFHIRQCLSAAAAAHSINDILARGAMYGWGFLSPNRYRVFSPLPNVHTFESDMKDS